MRSFARLEPIMLRDHVAEAREELRRARVEAVEIVGAARSRGESIWAEAKQKGYETGFAEGREAGREKGREEAREEALKGFGERQGRLVEVLRVLVEEIEARKERMLEQAEEDLLRLAMTIAERVAKRSCVVEGGSSSAAVNLAEALQLVGSWTELTIRVHGEDLAAMEEYAAGLKGALGGAKHVRIVVDEAVGAGGCVVETEATRVDATLEGQLGEAAAIVLGGMGRASGSWGDTA